MLKSIRCPSDLHRDQPWALNGHQNHQCRERSEGFENWFVEKLLHAVSYLVMDPARAHESRAVIPVAVVTATVGTSLIVVALRSYTRVVIIKKFGYDDIGAIVAVLMAIGCGVSIASETLYGLGRHIWTLDPSLIPLYLRTFYISIVMYNAALTSVKFTFLLQYYRIFQLTKIRNAILIASVFIGSWSLSQLLIVIFSCHPINKFWDSSVRGTCIPDPLFWYINAAGNILTDVTIFVLPLPMLWTMSLRCQQKIVLLGIFSLGFFTCAISLIRIRYLHLSPDITWDNVEPSCWSVTEPCSAIICVCLPVLRPLASRCASHGSAAKAYPQPQQQQHPASGRAVARRTAAVADHRAPSESSSQRGFVGGGIPDVRHAQEDLELQRVNSDPGFFSDAEVSAPGHAALVSHHRDSRRSRVLGVRPSVTVELGTAGPMPLEVLAPARGITVDRKSVVEGDGSFRVGDQGEE